MSSSDLYRFVQAQDGGEYETALAEIKAGRKRSHWIWYVFPQIAGLGMSSMSQTYAVRDREEAIAYLEHPLLLARLREITHAAAGQVKQGAALDRLMGSPIDAAKLVSSMTLFHDVARGLPPGASSADTEALAKDAATILAAGEAQGYPACRHTRSRLGT
jgi:uncharacterized protein (DUF1810 family)